MQSALLHPYQHRSSVIHRLPAALKLAAAVGGVFAIVLLPRMAWMAFAVGGTVLLGLAILSRVPFWHLGKRLLLVEPFVVGVALLSLFQPDGRRVFLGILTKSTLCLCWMVLLMATTRFSEVLGVLLRLGVPRLLVTTLALTYRYLFLLLDETGRMLRARRSRTFVRGRWLVWRSSATVAAHLFVRTSERAERIYAAMCARGWR